MLSLLWSLQRHVYTQLALLNDEQSFYHDNKRTLPIALEKCFYSIILSSDANLSSWQTNLACIMWTKTSHYRFVWHKTAVLYLTYVIPDTYCLNCTVFIRDRKLLMFWVSYTKTSSHDALYSIKFSLCKICCNSFKSYKVISFVPKRPFSVAVVLPARAERACFNFCYRCLIWAFSVCFCARRHAWKLNYISLSWRARATDFSQH